MEKDDNKTLPVPNQKAAPGALGEARRLADMWDVVIRAHYLAHDIRSMCEQTSVGPAGLGRVISELLADWASDFGEALEHAEAVRASARADAARRHRGDAPEAPLNDP